MHTLLAASLLALAVPAPSSAQNTAPTTAQMSPSRVDPRLGDAIKGNSGLQLLPADQSGVRLPSPAKPIDLNLPPLSETVSRKLLALQVWGLRVPANALKPSLMLTPQQPYLANAGELRVATNTGGRVNYNSTPAMPYGSVDISASPGWFVVLNGLRFTPRDWLLVECHVANGDFYTVQQSYPAPSSINANPSAGVYISYNLYAPRNGLLSAVFPPNSKLQESSGILIAAPSRSGSWQFGGCEITPVQP